MGLLDKIVDKTNELTEKAEKTYKEAITPEYREKISHGIEKFDEGMTKAVDKVEEKYHETFTPERKEKISKGIDNAVDKVADFFSGDKK